jgi:hypothetical protein
MAELEDDCNVEDKSQQSSLGLNRAGEVMEDKIQLPPVH